MALVTLLCWSGQAVAHDFWIQPQQFWAAPDTVVAATLQVGHGQFRQRSPIPAERITSLRGIGPAGKNDMRPGLSMGASDRDVSFQFWQPGTYVVVLETNQALSTLPAIRFNDYLKAEGLTAVIDWRVKNGTTNDPSREIYSRRAKSIIRIGDGDLGSQPQVTKPEGLSLEIVPERDPTELTLPQTLPVQILLEGRPLAGALVKLTDLDADAMPVETHLTDKLGHAVFTIPRRGSWLLNVIWSTPVEGNRTADSVTTFSSLSFGYPK